MSAAFLGVSSSVRGGVGIGGYGCRCLLEAVSISTCLDGLELSVISARRFRFRDWRYDCRCVRAVLFIAELVMVEGGLLQPSFG